MKTEFLPNKKFMSECLRLARKAYSEGEVPVGALVELNGDIIGHGYNKREKGNDPTAHAEILAIKMACEAMGSWRLTGANLYVTLEPCPMCIGAAINSRINRIIFAAHDETSGCLGSVINLSQLKFNHRPEIFRGFMQEESSNLLRDFFEKLRKDK